VPDLPSLESDSGVGVPLLLVPLGPRAPLLGAGQIHCVVAALALCATTWGPAGRVPLLGDRRRHHRLGVSPSRGERVENRISRCRGLTNAGGGELVEEEERQSVALGFAEPLLYVDGITSPLLGQLKGQLSLGSSWLRV